MTLLVISPSYTSHYVPLAVVARAVRAETGRRVVVATGPDLRSRVETDGFEWRPLRLAAGKNDGIVEKDPAIQRFLDATRSGPVETIRCQAFDREHDLLWNPEQVAHAIHDLCSELAPDEVLVDHVSFGSTLAMYATGASFVTLVPGHPSQLPVGDERYGIPASWPSCFHPNPEELAELRKLADRATAAFTNRWNEALAAIAPERPPVDDAFRVHGRRVLYNSVLGLQESRRVSLSPQDHRFVGPLVRDESITDAHRHWLDCRDGRPHVFVALGTFLSHRHDVLVRIVAALRDTGARASVATGSLPACALGPIPDDWVIAPVLPQVALLRGADLAITHGGNNSVQEALAAGVRQLVLPFSTDQFATAADLERTGMAVVLPPNEISSDKLAEAIEARIAVTPPDPVEPVQIDQIASGVLDR